MQTNMISSSVIIILRVFFSVFAVLLPLLAVSVNTQSAKRTAIILEIQTVIGTAVAACMQTLYTFRVMPVHYAGLALFILGLSFMVAEAFVPSFGVLGFGGIAAFVSGTILLMDEPFLRISLPFRLAPALISAGFLIVLTNRILIIPGPSMSTPPRIIGNIREYISLRRAARATLL